MRGSAPQTPAKRASPSGHPADGATGRSGTIGLGETGHDAICTENSRRRTGLARRYRRRGDTEARRVRACGIQAGQMARLDHPRQGYRDIAPGDTPSSLRAQPGETVGHRRPVVRRLGGDRSGTGGRVVRRDGGYFCRRTRNRMGSACASMLTSSLPVLRHQARMSWGTPGSVASPSMTPPTGTRLIALAILTTGKGQTRPSMFSVRSISSSSVNLRSPCVVK